MPRKKYARPYFERNAHFQAWLPETMQLAFLDYLQKYSVGETTAAQFRTFVGKLLQLDQQGITIVNVREQHDRDARALLLNRFGDIDDARLICVKGINMKNKTELDRDILCTHCKEAQHDIFKACQEIRLDFDREKNKLLRS